MTLNPDMLTAQGDPGLVVSPDCTEAQWQQVVIGAARFYGWRVYHTHDSRRSHAGWPDLVLCKPPRALFVELKARTGRLRPEQRAWLDTLAACGLEVALWRPADLDNVLAALGPHQQQRLTWKGDTR